MNIDFEKEEMAARLKGSLLEFTRFFFKHVTGKDFIVSQPVGRESHHITVSRALMQVFRLESLRHNINLPPGSGKSTFASMFAAYIWAHYPDSNFLYISYSHTLAVEHTSFIKTIVSSPMYRYLFDVSIASDSKAKDSFKTTHGGSIKAFGSSGGVTGQNAGLPALNRCSGGVIIDDAHKPDEAHSQGIREKVIRNYEETISQRPRGENVFMLHIGQRVHEDDLTNYLLSGADIKPWSSTIIKSLDDAENSFYPEMITAESLLAKKEKMPYVFGSQYQQDPLPAGGGIFKKEYFTLLDKEPEIIRTFLTCDTAETEKTYNDKTVFSFWGIYEIEVLGVKTGELGLHWLDCVELSIEPKDLEESLLEFWRDCLMHPVKPRDAFIEKKSTGTTLVSVLKEKLRTVAVRPIERSRASGSKTERFLRIQQYLSQRLVSLPQHGKHTEMCIKHMTKITANDSHRWDDIADTCADAVNIALIEKLLYNGLDTNTHQKEKLDALNNSFKRKLIAGAKRNGRIS